MQIFENISAEGLTHSLGWTIIHSLWQGLIVGTIVLLLVYCFAKGKQSANIRYGLFAGGMMLLLAWTLLTFGRMLNINGELPPIPDKGNVETEFMTIPHAVAAQPVIKSAKTQYAGMKRFSGWVEAQIPLIVLLWTLGMFALSLRFAGAYLQVVKIKRSGHFCQNAALLNKLKTMTKSMGLRQNIRLRIAKNIGGPMLIGWLKPVILLPASIVSALPPQQLEAIIAHELAHIRRHDYAINILQSVVEIVLFYHPVIWWLSKGMRVEREHCCDDLAVRICGNAMQYARALHHIETLKNQVHALPVAAFSGAGKGGLRHRIERLFSPDGDKNTPSANNGTTFKALIKNSAMNQVFNKKRPTFNTGLAGVSVGFAMSLALLFLLQIFFLKEDVTAEPSKNAMLTVAASTAANTSHCPETEELPLAARPKYEASPSEPTATPLPSGKNEQLRNNTALPQQSPSTPTRVETIIPQKKNGVSLNIKTSSISTANANPPKSVFRPEVARTNAPAKLPIVINGNEFNVYFNDVGFGMDSLPLGDFDFDLRLEDLDAQLQPLLDSIEYMTQRLNEQLEPLLQGLSETDIEEKLEPMIRNIERQAEEWEAKAEAWAEQLEREIDVSEWEELGEDFSESMERFGEKMERFGESMEEWGESFGRQFEDAFDDLDFNFNFSGNGHEKVLNVLKSELISDGYINSPDDAFSLTLNNKKMTVNGESVDEQTHQNYLDLVRLYCKGSIAVSYKTDNQKMNVSVK